MTSEFDEHTSRALEIAAGLITAGVPLFVALPAANGIGFALPLSWQRADAVSSRRALQTWQPGMALCAVMGSALDLIDIDPRAGSPDWNALAEWPTPYAVAETPSGGQHVFIASLQVGSRDGVLTGVDIKGGRPDGSGRGFAFIAPTVRASKVDGSARAYVWTQPPDVEALPGLVPFDTSGKLLAKLVADKLSGSSNGHKVAPAWNAPSRELELFRPPARTFTLEHARAYVAPALAELAAAPDGERNSRLNTAAKTMSHFGNEFWPPEQAREWLLSALPAKEGRTWDPDQTIRSAYRSAERDWRAELVEGARFQSSLQLPVDSSFTTENKSALNLPEEFWSARPSLAHIRQAAHARGRSGDVALYAVLARVAALWPHDVRLDTGVASAASANLYVAIVGPSSSGKSTGVSVAEDLVPVPSWCREPGKFADSYPLGTGEGIAEAFMGWEVRPVAAVADEDGNMVQPLGRDGTPKTEKVRTQTRHNALFYMDEGEALGKMLERIGATVGETLRRGWTGGTLGQANGRAETTRIINGGTYSIGLVIGFQPETCQLLLADAAAGTPQRFLWAWANDPSIPSHRVAHPGALSSFWPDPRVDWIAGTTDPGRPVTFAESIRERLWVEAVSHGRGELAVGELDGHRPLTLVKVATLLAQLDARRNVTEEDWALAECIWSTSTAVRDAAREYGRRLAGKAAAASKAAYADRESAAETARLAVHASAEGAAVERVAHRIAVRVHDAEGGQGMARRDVQSKVIAGKERVHFVAALAHAVERGWVIEDGAQVRPGGSRPVS